MKMFSIIVPIYKVEKYLKECIESVINQKFNDYELVLVDDGSPDNSGKICDEYKNKYPNITAIHKKNGGLSDARNCGLEYAKGKYIIFLDGDDTLYDDCLKKIACILDKEEIDLLSCDFNIYGNEQKNINPIVKKVGLINEYFDFSQEIPWAAWRNVYNKRIIDKYDIKFIKGLIGAEDCEFFIKFFDKAIEKKYTNINIVNYRINREDSITNNISYNAIIGQLETFSKYFYQYYEDDNKEIYGLFSKKYLNTITTIYNIHEKEQIKEIYDNIKKNRMIFKYAKGFKYDIAKFLWMIMGYKYGSKVLRTLNRK